MKNIRYKLLPVLLLLLLSTAARAADDDEVMNEQEMHVVGKGTVKAILKSDMIELDDDTRYRLENILIPPYEDQPAVDELTKEFLGKPVTVYSFHPEKSDDKVNLPYAHVVSKTGEWLQQDLISKGLAWVYCSETSPQTVAILKQAEEKARVDKEGFWKQPAYSIKSPQEVGDFMDSYQIVEGQITAIGMRPGSPYIDFIFARGKKRDFTVRFENNDTFAAFWDDPVTGGKDKDGLDHWKGRVVRVRGWVRNDHGPAIVLTRKEQLDIVKLHPD